MHVKIATVVKFSPFPTNNDRDIDNSKLTSCHITTFSVVFQTFGTELKYSRLCGAPPGIKGPFFLASLSHST